ncbi:hypothetical protein Lepto7375DRAFT_8057 [Leptolyngbya sp. PCC 7375]|nr:hypothetical protein Lepto7375DRAFT_8057 [Leptolyngbya sp. PCC 7375]
MPQQRITRKRKRVLTNIGLQKLQTAKRKAEIWEDENLYSTNQTHQRGRR